MSEVDIVGGYDTFVAALRAGGFEPPPEGPVHATIHHEGQTVVDEPRPIGPMLVGNATFHQQMHDEQLLALRG